MLGVPFGVEVNMPRAEHLFVVWLYTLMTYHCSQLKACNEAAYKSIVDKLVDHKRNPKFKESCDYLDSECNLRLGALDSAHLLPGITRVDLGRQRSLGREV